MRYHRPHAGTRLLDQYVAFPGSVGDDFTTLDHRQRVPPLFELEAHLVHKLPHQVEPDSARADILQLGVEFWLRHARRVKLLALVHYYDLTQSWLDNAGDLYRADVLAAVCVLDDVGTGFVDSHLAVENFRFLQPCGSRSEEHTSELQSREKLVCRLL